MGNILKNGGISHRKCRCLMITSEAIERVSRGIGKMYGLEILILVFEE